MHSGKGAIFARIHPAAAVAPSFRVASVVALKSRIPAQQAVRTLVSGEQQACWSSCRQQRQAAEHGIDPNAVSTTINTTSQPRRMTAL